MKEITVKIPEMGNKPGTLGWLAQKLSGVSLTVKPNSSGVTALYAQFSNDGQEKFLARPTTSPRDAMAADQDGYKIRELHGQKFKTVPSTTYNSSPPDQERGLFGALTPAAKEAADGWLGAIVEGFAQQWANDSTDEDVEITVSS